MQRQFPSQMTHTAWADTVTFTKEDVLNPPSKTNCRDNCLQKIIRTFWSYLGRSSATRDLFHRNIIVGHRRPPSLRDRMVKAKVAIPTNKISDQHKRPQTCQYCTRISQSWMVLKQNNKINHNTIKLANCQNNNLILYLECNLCNMKYFWQTQDKRLTGSSVTFWHQTPCQHNFSRHLS